MQQKETPRQRLYLFKAQARHHIKSKHLTVRIHERQMNECNGDQRSSISDSSSLLLSNADYHLAINIPQ